MRLIGVMEIFKENITILSKVGMTGALAGASEHFKYAVSIEYDIPALQRNVVSFLLRHRLWYLSAKSQLPVKTWMHQDNLTGLVKPILNADQGCRSRIYSTSTPRGERRPEGSTSTSQYGVAS